MVQCRVCKTDFKEGSTYEGLPKKRNGRQRIYCSNKCRVKGTQTKRFRTPLPSNSFRECSSCQTTFDAAFNYEGKARTHGYRMRRFCSIECLQNADTRRTLEMRQMSQAERYGITFQQRNEISLEQDGLCAICGDPEGEDRLLDIDHDHQSLAVRGLLCGLCNKILGLARDNTETLRLAIKYLENHDLRISG